MRTGNSKNPMIVSSLVELEIKLHITPDPIVVGTTSTNR